MNTKEQIDTCIAENYEKLVNYVNQKINDIALSRDLVHDIIITIHKPSYEKKLYSTENIEQFLFEMAYFYRIKNGFNNIYAPAEKYTSPLTVNIDIAYKNIKHLIIDEEYIDDEIDAKIFDVTYILDNTNQLNWMEKQYVRDRLYCFKSNAEYARALNLSKYMVNNRLKFCIDVLQKIYFKELPLYDDTNASELRLRKKFSNKKKK